MTLPVAHSAGNPGAMGRAQGRAFASEIHAAAAFYNKLAQRKAGLDPAFGQLGPYVDATKQHFPHLADEVEGLAEGAEIDAEVAWFFICMEEVWPFEACTTLATDRWLMHAEQWYAGHSGIGVVVARPDDGPAFVSPTCAGFLPAVGLNASGFAQGIDSLTTTDDRTGIPRLIVSRSSLGAQDMQDAITRATRSHRAGGYSHVLATSGRAVIVETTATRSATLVEERAHTNHVLSWNLAPVSPNSSDGSLARLKRAVKLLETSPPKSIEDCMSLLGDHDSQPQSICHHEGEDLATSATVFGMICDLQTGVVAVSAGRPCSSEWEEHVVPGFVTSEASHVG